MQNYPKIMQKDDWNDQDFFLQNVSIFLSGQEASRPIRDSSTLESFPFQRCAYASFGKNDNILKTNYAVVDFRLWTCGFNARKESQKS